MCLRCHEPYHKSIAFTYETIGVLSRTDANMAVSVRSVVIEIPILASMNLDGMRKQSQVMIIKKMLGK